jgi:hypothetical protein
MQWQGLVEISARVTPLPWRQKLRRRISILVPALENEEHYHDPRKNARSRQDVKVQALSCLGSTLPQIMLSRSTIAASEPKASASPHRQACFETWRGVGNMSGGEKGRGGCGVRLRVIGGDTMCIACPASLADPAFAGLQTKLARRSSYIYELAREPTTVAAQTLLNTACTQNQLQNCHKIVAETCNHV